MQAAQLRLAEEHFGIPFGRSAFSFGFSTGELTALSYGGVFSLEQLLTILIPLARDCAELSAGSSLGVLSTTRTDLRREDLEHLCRVVIGQGRGLIGPTAFVSPRTWPCSSAILPPSRGSGNSYPITSRMMPC